MSKPLLKLTKDEAIDHLGGTESHLLGTDPYPVPTGKALVRKCICVVFAKVFVATPAWNRTRDLHASAHSATGATYM